MLRNSSDLWCQVVQRMKWVSEVWSGSGLVSLEPTDLVDSILLVDSSKLALQDATDKIMARGMTNCEVLYSDFTEDVPELKADIVLLPLVLLHMS
ncbi:hypothetical protein CSV63_15650 [Sporosarcina sp. P34]|uniref:hypothetical protein n=1 Tax=Sporosarcina sp. P34 TaxID=2048247 RepID=UPI000C16EC56|nr:hypothetical protein [Sporosarcina sp. P34]PID13861.1 hypothetical protein CSV63_15650 [Sporosarcina sp. P34]